MPTSEELRVQLAVAELEERLVALKGGGDPDELRALKEDLRYARWIARGGPHQEPTNRADEAQLARWRAENEG